MIKLIEQILCHIDVGKNFHPFVDVTFKCHQLPSDRDRVRVPFCFKFWLKLVLFKMFDCQKSFLNRTNANTMFTYPHHKSTNTHHSNALYILYTSQWFFRNFSTLPFLFSSIAVERKSMNICSHEWLCMYISFLK